MSIEIITWLEGEIARLKGTATVQKVETDVVAIGTSALNYIKNNALTDLYNIALAVLTGAATGTPWATLGATVVTQGEAAGIAIEKGAESIVLAQAQADLIAAGTLVSPTSGAVVTSAAVTPSAAPATPAA